MTVFAIIPLSSIMSITVLLIAQACIVVVLLASAFLLRMHERGRQYFPVLYAFFAAGTVVLLSTLFSGNLVDLLGFSIMTPSGIAVAKFSESILRVTALLVLMALIGADRKSMYLNKGRLGIGLLIGAIAFVIFPIIAYLTVASQEGVLTKLLSLSPWILLFVLSNGLMEELLYRGVFLQRCEPFMGKNLSNLLTAIVFTLIHTQVTYAADMFVFLVLIVFPLSLIWGFMMQKTGNIWGAILFHAAADCLIIFVAFAAM
jgi:membrane protease YdiL (CAAX protease family)